MKKLLIGVLAVACCFAFSAPVFAEIKIGGMISAEQFYWGVSQERRTPGGQWGNNNYNVGDYSSTEFAMGQPWNRLNVQYISDDKKIGGMLEVRNGGQKGGGNSVNPTGNPTGEYNFSWELAYIDWHFNPNFYLRVGRQTQTFAIYGPEQQMGHNHGHIVLAGFGNIHGGTSRDGVRAYIKFNDMVRMELQVLNPDSDGTPGAPGTTGQFAGLPQSQANGGAFSLVAESNTIPRFDMSLPIKVANFSIEPSFTWARSEYSDVAPGSDTSYDSWGTGVGFRAGFGPFTLSGEYIYGQNLGGHTYVGAANGVPRAYQQGPNANLTTNGYPNVQLEDTTSHNAWIQAQFNFGPFAIQGIVGTVKEENDGNPDRAQFQDGAEFEFNRWAYGLQFPIYIAKNLKVVPQVWYFDYDDSAKIGGRAVNGNAVDTDLGSEVMAGVFWQLTF